MSKHEQRRAVGIIRCSPDEKNDDKHSPEVQAEAIRDFCRREGWELIEPLLEEIDVSGRWELERRRGLSRAVVMVEDTEADVVIVARFDRMIRNTKVQAEITARVEAAGGDLFAIDSGFITNGNATQRMSAGFLGLVSQFHSDTTRERSAEGVQAAIDAGIPPFKGATAGYVRPIIGVRRNGKPIHGPLVPADEATVEAVRRAWEMRADGATVSSCRAFLADHGIEYSYPGVIKLFGSKLPLGELHHGKFRPNLNAHPAIIDRDLWDRVQAARSPRGRYAKSPRLLSRLGVLRCAACDGRMSIGDDWRGYKLYRCSTSEGDCPSRSTIMADTADEVVYEAACVAAEGLRGRAVDDEQVERAELEAESAELKLRNLVAMLEGLEDVAGTRDKLAAAGKEARRLRARADRMKSEATGLDESVDPRDPRLSLAARRSIVTATIRRALVVRSAPGLQGAARITVEPFRK
jgi:DNA invertase Pin-like site-specific DNA recombinase